jgi:nuclear cap-binding protein subunit 1
MADTDARDERDERRGVDSYRGGGNKRRRDGKFATEVVYNEDEFQC